jgi:hypothetical protein
MSPARHPPVPTIIRAVEDPELFGGLAVFRDLRTWEPWLVALAALYGLPLTAAQQERFCHHTGRAEYKPPRDGWKEAVFITGRQSGKTRMAALIAGYEAAFCRTEPGSGDVYALTVAQDHRASLRASFSYARVPFDSVPLLKGLVRERKVETLRLQNNVVLAAYPCRPESVRGLRAQVVICDELGFFRSSEGSPQDVEMLRAARPTLATTGGRLIMLSSPAGQLGALWELFERYFGHDDSPVLIWRASAPEMNPTLPADYLQRMELDDPEGYRSEVLGEFRAGTTALFDPEAIRVCTIQGRRELPPTAGRVYKAFLDASGGRRDAFTVCIGHREGKSIVIDVVRVWSAPFNPSAVVADCAQLLKRYGLTAARGDRFAAEWVAEAFRVNGISYEESPLDASALYLEMLPVLNASQVELLDLHDLRQELIGLERRRGPSGRDRVVHPPSRHDDIANCVAGLVHLLHRHRRRMFEGLGTASLPASEREVYRTCPHCGTQHLTTKEVPDCPQRGWTLQQVMSRLF